MKLLIDLATIIPLQYSITLKVVHYSCGLLVDFSPTVMLRKYRNLLIYMCIIPPIPYTDGSIQSCSATAYVMSAALSPGALIALLVCMLILIGKRMDVPA